MAFKKADVRHSHSQQAKNVITGDISMKVRCSLSREVAMNGSAKGLAQRMPIPAHPHQALLGASR